MEICPVIFEIGKGYADWAGSAFGPYFHTDSEQSVGSYYVLNAGSRVISEGPSQGKTLEALLQENQHDWLGENFDLSHFPIQMTIYDLDAEWTPHVYPDESAIPLLDGATPCTQFWYFLNSAPGGTLGVGFSSHALQYQIEDAFRSQKKLNALMQNFDAVPGDAYLIPSGRPFFISGKHLLVSVSQVGGTLLDLSENEGESYEINKLSINFAERNSVRIAADTTPALFSRREPLADYCRYFTVDLLDLTSDWIEQLSPLNGGHILLPLGDGVSLQTGDITLELPVAHAVLVPATAGKYTLSLKKPTQILKVMLRHG